MESRINDELMDLLPLLNSDNEQDIKLGVGIFNAQFYCKSIIFPIEFKKGLKPKWTNFSLEYKRRITKSIFRLGIDVTDHIEYYIYLI